MEGLSGVYISPASRKMCIWTFFFFMGGGTQIPRRVGAKNRRCKKYKHKQDASLFRKDICAMEARACSSLIFQAPSFSELQTKYLQDSTSFAEIFGISRIFPSFN